MNAGYRLHIHIVLRTYVTLLYVSLVMLCYVRQSWDAKAFGLNGICLVDERRRQPMVEISRIGEEFYGVPQCVVFSHDGKQLATIKNWRDHPSPIRPFTSWICLNELKDGRKDTSFTSFKKGWIGIHASLWREARCWRHSRHLARGCEVFFTIYLIMKFQINA